MFTLCAAGGMPSTPLSRDDAEFEEGWIGNEAFATGLV